MARATFLSSPGVVKGVKFGSQMLKTQSFCWNAVFVCCLYAASPCSKMCGTPGGGCWFGQGVDRGDASPNSSSGNQGTGLGVVVGRGPPPPPLVRDLGYGSCACRVASFLFQYIPIVALLYPPSVPGFVFGLRDDRVFV